MDQVNMMEKIPDYWRGYNKTYKEYVDKCCAENDCLGCPEFYNPKWCFSESGAAELNF